MGISGFCGRRVCDHQAVILLRDGMASKSRHQPAEGYTGFVRLQGFKERHAQFLRINERGGGDAVSVVSAARSWTCV